MDSIKNSAWHTVSTKYGLVFLPLGPSNPKCPIFMGTFPLWVIFIFCPFQTLQESRNPPGYRSTEICLESSFYHPVKADIQRFLPSSPPAWQGPDSKGKVSSVHFGGRHAGKGVECHPRFDLCMSSR